MNIEGHVALVTGANKGLGREVARKLARKGLAVYLGSRDAARGEEAMAALGRAGASVVAIEIDVTNASSVQRAAARIADEHGHLDVLVNNAGIHVGAPALEITVDDMRKTYETNVFALVEVTRAMLPLLQRAKAPRIVNVASTTASHTLTCDPASRCSKEDRSLAYASSKARLRSSFENDNVASTTASHTLTCNPASMFSQEDRSVAYASSEAASTKLS